MSRAAARSRWEPGPRLISLQFRRHNPRSTGSTRASLNQSTRSTRSRTCIFYSYANYNFFTCIFCINESQVYFSDSMKSPLEYLTPAKRILQVSVPMDRHRLRGLSAVGPWVPTLAVWIADCRSLGTDAPTAWIAKYRSIWAGISYRNCRCRSLWTDTGCAIIECWSTGTDAVSNVLTVEFSFKNLSRDGVIKIKQRRGKYSCYKFYERKKNESKTRERIAFFIR